MQEITGDEVYIDDDSSLSEINKELNKNNKEEDEEEEDEDEEEEEEEEEDEEEEEEEEEDEEEEYNIFQNADDVEYFENFPFNSNSQQKINIVDQYEEEQDDSGENMVINQHNDHTDYEEEEQKIEFSSDLPPKETTPPTNTMTAIPWQRVEPKDFQVNANDFYQDTPITLNDTKNNYDLNLMPLYGLVVFCALVIVYKSKCHTDPGWNMKDEKEYYLPLYNRHFKSEIKSC
ncbi:hypothetical protein G6F66_005664 [Rhizopus arrhizus]|nr:hypothetical protein G6F23_011614 [Rhizopus arrhizus]KAG1293925.1 hypothetical protein G6F66_005664 [Rhizopus arrhizus]